MCVRVRSRVELTSWLQVVLDEGHRIRDPRSALAAAFAQLRTRRRCVLTGYPLQNALGEYYTMLQFAVPGLLGSREQFRLKYVSTPVGRAREIIPLARLCALSVGHFPEDWWSDERTG